MTKIWILDGSHFSPRPRIIDEPTEILHIISVPLDDESITKRVLEKAGYVYSEQATDGDTLKWHWTAPRKLASECIYNMVEEGLTPGIPFIVKRKGEGQ